MTRVPSRTIAVVFAAMLAGCVAFADSKSDPGPDIGGIARTQRSFPRRHRPWWPFASGPYYGDVPASIDVQTDVIRVPVGSFRAGTHLAVPHELIGRDDILKAGGKQYAVVQVRPQALAPDIEQQIAQLGAEIVERIPVNALIVRVDSRGMAQLAASSLLQHVELYHPAFRVSPEIGTAAAFPGEGENAPFHLAIRLFSGESAAAVVEHMRDIGVEHVRSDTAWVYCDARPLQIIAIAQIEAVAQILEDGPVIPLGSRSASFVQSSTGYPGDFPYWRVGLQGDGQIIHITDTGVSVDAADLADTRSDSGWRPNMAPTNVLSDHRKIVAYRYLGDLLIPWGGGGDLLACDAPGNGARTHGQIVASVALGNATRGAVPVGPHPSPTDDCPNGPTAACSANPNFTWKRAFGPGVALNSSTDDTFTETSSTGLDGIAKGAKLVFVDASGGTPSCPEKDGSYLTLSPGNLGSSISGTWSLYGASIHNFSFGSSGSPYGTGAQSIDGAVSTSPANLVVVAAGNAGDGGAVLSPMGAMTVTSEATCKNCVSVGSSYGPQGTLWSFSAEGPLSATNRRHVVTVVAEGYDSGCRSDEVSEDQTGLATCAENRMLGTSVSAAVISGSAAVMREYFAEGFYPDGTNANPTNSRDKVPLVSERLLRALFIAGTQPVTDAYGADNLKVPAYRLNHFSGYGQFALYRALPLADAPGQTVPGLIVHDWNGDGTTDGVTSMPGLLKNIPYQQSASQDFFVQSVDDDLAVALVWDDPNSSAALVNDLDLEVRWCGADQVCGNTDDQVWSGNVFTTDANEDGTTSDTSFAYDHSSFYYQYSISNSELVTPYKNHVDVSEAVFIASRRHAPDLDFDGTPDVRSLTFPSNAPYEPSACIQDPHDTTHHTCMRTGRWRLTVKRSQGTNALAYSVVIVGPVTTGSSVRFDRQTVSCNADETLVVSESLDRWDPSCDSTSCSASSVSARTTIQVYDNSNPPALLDQETGPAMVEDPPGSLRFRLARRIPLTESGIVTWGNGKLESVFDGYTLKAIYGDVTGDGTTTWSSTRVTTANIVCRPSIDWVTLPQIGADAPFVLAGGCDGDKYLDQGESFVATFQFMSVSPTELLDAQATLNARDVDKFGNVSLTDSVYLSISSPTRSVGTLRFEELQRVSYGLQVVGTPPPRQRVRLQLCVSAPKSGHDYASCKAVEVLLQANDERHVYITDCPTGCTLNWDRNNDETLESHIRSNPLGDPLDTLRRDLPETQIHYEDMTDTRFGHGNPSFAGPWDFDTGRNGFTTGHSVSSQPSPTTTQITNWGEDSNWNDILEASAAEDANGNGTLDQNWSSNGGCGWMTQSTSSTTGGIWHTGTIGSWTAAHSTAACGGSSRANDSVCEQYDIEAGTSGTHFWWEGLRTPTVHPVHFGVDPDGFNWVTSIVDWSWNMQLDITDSLAQATMEFDLDLQDGRKTLLGDEYVQKTFGAGTGLVAGNGLALYGGGFAFAPTNATTGDETNGTIGGNRAGKRGCYFNDLTTISDPIYGSAARRPVVLPSPADDDCDNNYSLGPNGCPGACGVDDDGNGVVDDPGEICPCRRCGGPANGPNAGKPCTSESYCNPGGGHTYTCTLSVNAAGKPSGYGDDVCGNGLAQDTTDEYISATFGLSSSLRQTRNAGLWLLNGVGDQGRRSGDVRYTRLEDLYGPAGTDWAAELGFVVLESNSGYLPQPSYGLGVDDMVIEWEETHPIAATGSACALGDTRFNRLGACAQLSVGAVFNRGSGDRDISVTLVDPYLGGGNLGECTTAQGQAGLLVRATSAADTVGESYCLSRVSPSGFEFTGTVRTTTRVNTPSDGFVFVAMNGPQPARVTISYIDKDDGVPAHLWGLGADGHAGISGFDDDGDGTVDEADEQCPLATILAAGRSPHKPGSPARFSDDTCGCSDNPVTQVITVDFDTVDLIISDVKLLDRVDASDQALSGDNDGFADPRETVRVDVRVRNMANFAVENVELKISTPDVGANAPVACVIQDKIRIPRLERHGVTGYEYDTSELGSEHFSFVAGSPIRTSVDQDLASHWSLAVSGLAKAALGSTLNGFPLAADIPILGTTIPQTFQIRHNLDINTPLRVADYFDNMESYGNDSMALCTPASGASTCSCVSGGYACYVKRNSGDDPAETKATRCQVNNPNNPFGNNTDPGDYCELGAGFPVENNWHLHRSTPLLGKGTTCGRTNGCIESHNHTPNPLPPAPTSQNALGSGILNTILQPPLNNKITSPQNRMYWIRTRQSVQLGTGTLLRAQNPVSCSDVSCIDQDQSPVLEYWTQLSLVDSRYLGGTTPFAYDAALTYICVDKNNNNDCDTLEDGTKSGNERWEPLHAYYSPEVSYRLNNFINCQYDPSDDGNTESDYYSGSYTVGPSSTCYPQLVDSCLGSTEDQDTTQYLFSVPAQCWPEKGVPFQEGESGTGVGKWIRKLYNLKQFRGQKALFRWHVSPGELKGVNNCTECGNVDDGWYIDDVQIYGLGGTTPALSVDNDSTLASWSCPTTPVSSPIARLAAIPYPRSTSDGLPRAVVACSSSNSAQTHCAFDCDYDHDGTTDATTSAQSEALGKPFILDGSHSSADTCIGGALLYKFENVTLYTAIQDWSMNSSVAIADSFSCTYRLSVRCSSDASGNPLTATTTITINMPWQFARGLSVSNDKAKRVEGTDSVSLAWAGDGTFDIAKGDLGALRAAGDGSRTSFSAAVPVVCSYAQSSYTDSDAHVSGAGTYYLVRSHVPDGTWNDGSNLGDRDTTMAPCGPPSP